MGGGERDLDDWIDRGSPVESPSQFSGVSLWEQADGRRGRDTPLTGLLI